MIGADRVKLIDSGYLVDRYYIVWFQSKGERCVSRGGGDAIVKLQMTKVKSPKIETGDSAQALLPQYSPLRE